MLEFFAAGGFSMPIVLALGLAAVLTASLALARPDARRIQTARGLERAQIHLVIAAVAMNVWTVGSHAPRISEREGVPLAPVVLLGFAESLTPAVLGFSLLMLSSILLAAAARRVD
jgi:hypothetical protein